MMARKKILWLCSWYPGKTEPFNGDFIQRHAKAAAIYNDIHVIHVFAVRGNQVPVKEEFLTPVTGLTEQVIYYNYSATLIGRLVSHFKMIRLYKKAIRGYIQNFGKPEILHVHVPMKAGIAGAWAKKIYQIPLVVTEHWGIYNRVIQDNYETRAEYFKNFTRRIFKASDKIVSVSQFLVDCLHYYFNIKGAVVIPNVANTDLFYPKEQNEKFRFIHVSNMVPLKNAEGIIRAFSKLKTQHATELILVGNLDETVPGYAKKLSLPSSSIQFRGEVSYEKVALEMQDAHCLVLFSDIENSPCVIGEALCCGLPVIATNVGGIPELVMHENGLLIRARKENELIAAMEEMMKKYSSYNRQQISEQARKRFSYEEIGKQFDSLYDSMIRVGKSNVKRET